MTELHDLIREELPGLEWRPATLADAIRAVLEMHRPQRIYEPCGHNHQDDEAGVQEVAEVGRVCEEGYLYTICFHCCADDVSQTEECAMAHDQDLFCHPCPTVRAVAEQLGLIAAVET